MLCMTLLLKLQEMFDQWRLTFVGKTSVYTCSLGSEKGHEHKLFEGNREIKILENPMYANWLPFFVPENSSSHSEVNNGKVF